MTKRAERILFSVLAVFLLAGIAAAQLNPTVKVLSAPSGPIPETCTVGMAAQEQPRVDVSQIPEPASRSANVAPPSTSLRGLLHDAQTAADRGDRAAFHDAVARAKGMLATYAAGGERTAATDLIRVYDDLDRVWSYQLDNATGAFFDASTVPAEIMRGYPGYERAISDQVFIDSAGHRFYPTAETRDYLLREAAQRLNRLGVAVPMRAMRTPHVMPRMTTPEKAVARAEKAPTREKRSEKAEAKHPRATEPQHARSSSATARQTTHPTTHVAEAKAKPAEPRKAEPQAKKPQASPDVTDELNEALKGSGKVAVPAAHPAEKTRTAELTPPKSSGSMKSPSPSAALPTNTSAVPAQTTATSAPSAATTSTSMTTTASSSSVFSPSTTSAATASGTTATETTATSTASAETTASSTDTTGTEGKTQQPQGKGMILPIILIVVGVGVLIVLFRASS